MTSKRSRPIDDPPSAESSSSSEEEVEEEEEEEAEEEEEEPITPVTKQQQLDSDNEEEEEESDGDTTPAPSVNKPTPTQLSLEEKKGVVNRLWSFNDEITVLQGIIQFKNQYNKDPSSSDEFFNFIKNDLGTGKFTKAQLMDKVRRLKKKYRNHLTKSSPSGKDPEISNPHELKSFHLSKKIWGDLSGKGNSNCKVTVASLSDDNVVNGVVGNGDVVASGGRVGKKMKVDSVGEEKVKVKVDVVMAESNEGGDDFNRVYPYLMNAFKGDGVYRVPLLDDLKSCLNLVDSSELKEWDKKWKEIHVAESELYLSRIALIEETTRLVMDAVKSAQC